MTADERLDGLTEAQRELLDLLLAQQAGAEQAGRVAPRDEVEAALARIWQDVLETPEIGIDDDYFTLGGDSILAIVVTARAEQEGLAFGTHELFEHRTVRALAEVVRAAGPDAPVAPAAPLAAAAPGEAGERAGAGLSGRRPLTGTQQALLYHSLASPAAAAYHVQVGALLLGPLEPAAFAAAWRHAVAAHPALRTSVHVDPEGAPYQLVHPAAELPLEVEDWTGLDEAVRERRWADLLTADRERGFDLATPPLARVAVARVGAEAHRFLLAHHHLVLDGWSQQIVLRDVLDAYAALRDGRRPEPAAGGAELPAGGDRDGDGDGPAFWSGYLDPVPAPLLVGAGSAGGAGGADGRHRDLTVELAADVSAGVRSAARTHGVTPATVLRAAWAVTLGAHTGRPDVVHGLTVSGRDGVDGPVDAVGMLISTVPVLARLHPDAPLERWLCGLRAEQARAAERGGPPLSTIERWLGLPGGQRLFDTVLVIENFPVRVQEGEQVAGLRIAEADVWVVEDFPLVVEARPGARLRLRARHSAGVPAAALLAGWQAALAAMPAAATVGDLLAATRQRLRGWAADAADERRARASDRLAAVRRQPGGAGS